VIIREFVFFTRGYLPLVFVLLSAILVSQSVKEVLQSLVDDNLVQSDKIGSSNCASLFLPSFSDYMFNTVAYMPQSSGAFRLRGVQS
jgi:hypothetical protein